MSARLFGLIPAAGSGSRMGLDLPKQYLALAGRPLIEHTVRAMLASPDIDTVFVVLAAGDTHFRAIDWGPAAARVAPLYCGGDTRRDTVLNGLLSAGNVADPDDWVLVHDAARPCLGRAELDKLVAALRNDDVGGLLAVPVADTLKRADAAQRVDATEPREALWQAQTPQMFRHGVLVRALQHAGQVTDEAAAVEALGLKPRLVEGARSNIKATYPADIAVIESMLKGSA